MIPNRRPAALLLLALLVGCGGKVPECRVLWTPGPNPRVPLALLGKLTTDLPTSARVTLSDGERTTTLERWPELASERELLVLGFHPATSYTVRVEVTDAGGRSTAADPFEWATPPLPANSPLSVTVCRP